MNSVQWCEANGILEAIKNIPTNSTAHIHTDSKGTIQGLRAIMTKSYKKIRQLKHKDIFGQILEEIYENHKMIILEWVKGHENMEWERHNWISKLKMQGNEWADEEAYKAIRQDITNKAIYDKYMLKTETGQLILWTDLAKLCKIWHEKERSKRLEKPTESIYEHGQGGYMQMSRADRSLAFNTLKNITGKREKWHYQALKYMKNAIMTRSWAFMNSLKSGEMVKVYGIPVTDQICPICKLAGYLKIQTKEHIWQGECVATKNIVNWETYIRKECTSKKLDQIAQDDICRHIQQEREEVCTNKHDIINHGRASTLFGMWSNQVINRIKEVLLNNQWEPGNAMNFTLQLMKKIQEIAGKIADRFEYNIKIFIPDWTMEEQEEYNAVKDIKQTTNQRILAIKFDKWEHEYKISTWDMSTWEVQAYISDQAEIRKITKEEVSIELLKAKGLIRINMFKDVSRYKIWKESPIKILEDAVYKTVGILGIKTRKKNTEKIQDIYAYLLKIYSKKLTIIKIIKENEDLLKNTVQIYDKQILTQIGGGERQEQKDKKLLKKRKSDEQDNIYTQNKKQQKIQEEVEYKKRKQIRLEIGMIPNLTTVDNIFRQENEFGTIHKKGKKRERNLEEDEQDMMYKRYKTNQSSENKKPATQTEPTEKRQAVKIVSLKRIQRYQPYGPKTKYRELSSLNASQGTEN